MSPMPSPDDWDEFVDYVLDNAPPTKPEAVWAELLKPDILGKTKDALSELHRDLSETVAEKKRTLPTYRYVNWRRIEGDRTKEWLTARSRQVKKAAHEIHQELMGRTTNEGRHLARRLATAIQRHRLACVAAGLDPEPHDRELWSLLGSLTAQFGTERWTLDEAIGRGVWLATEEPDGGEPR